MSSSRLLFGVLLRNTRPAIQIRCQPSLPRYQRSFSTTPRNSATPANMADFTAAFQKTSLFKKLSSHPEALRALQDFAQKLQDAGVDLTSGKPPSALKMMKLAANSEFRESMKRMTDEMSKAGVDFSSKEVMDEVMTLKKSIDPK